MHERATRRVLTAVILCAWIGSVPAAAEPIQVTSGYLDMNGLVGEFAVTGERGFSYAATAYAQNGFWGPWSEESCYDFACVGDPVPLDAGWSGSDFTGTATLEGRTFERVGSITTNTSMFVRFAASLDLPEAGPDPMSVATPFTFRGVFHHPGSADQLVGSGWATAMLTPVSFEGQPLWAIRQVRYDFSPEPIPEPSTLLLVAGGAWVGTRWRRRRGKP